MTDPNVRIDFEMQAVNVTETSTVDGQNIIFKPNIN